MNANVVSLKIEWAEGDKGQTGLSRAKFEVVQVVPYAETLTAKGPHLLVKFENGNHRLISTQTATKLIQAKG